MGGRLIDADKLIELIDDDIASHDLIDMPRQGYDVCLCTLKMVKQYIKALPTVETVPLEAYRSMEQTVYKLTQALAEAEPTKHYNTESYKMTVTDFPPVEYAPIKHGRWIYDDEAYPGGNPYGHYNCDQCGESVPHKTIYCPNCGARMFDNDIDVSDKNVGKIERRLNAPKHGRWIEDEYGFLVCSECGNTAEYLPILGQIETPYCSECGARMDEVEE